jgi:hypothetical protein
VSLHRRRWSSLGGSAGAKPFTHSSAPGGALIEMVYDLKQSLLHMWNGCRPTSLNYMETGELLQVSLKVCLNQLAIQMEEHDAKVLWVKAVVLAILKLLLLSFWELYLVSGNGVE